MDIIKKERVVVEYAETLEELQVKGIKWHHDHAWFHYFGLTANVPKELQEFIKENKNEDCTYPVYVLLAEEEEPYIPEKYD
jgi:hypothetical protein